MPILRLEDPPAIVLSRGARFARPTLRLLTVVALLASAGMCPAQPLPPSAGPSATEVPNDLRNVGVTEHLDAQAPPDLPFVDSSGKPVHLKDFFDGVRPVILTVNYSNCPMLCSLQLNGLFTGLQGVPWNIGRTYQMLTVSMDPTETSARAERTKQKYLNLYGRPGVGGGWHVLTGRDEDIHRLTETVGYRYAYDKQQKQYAHPAVIMILKPDGRVSRYLYGIEYDPQTLRLAPGRGGPGKDRLDGGPGAVVLLPLRCHAGTLRAGGDEGHAVGRPGDAGGDRRHAGGLLADRREAREGQAMR